MTTLITEPSRSIPLDSTYDGAVVGGGIAGVASAIAAVRQGTSTALIERFCGLGGLATLGNVIKYLPICDGYGLQICGGLAEELLHLSVADVNAEIPEVGIKKAHCCWTTPNPTKEDLAQRKKTRYQTSFNPNSYQIEMEHLLKNKGVVIMPVVKPKRVQTM